ncbi:hypothetical protein AB1N83_000226 [Pleurotus pulmonarius]
MFTRYPSRFRHPCMPALLAVVVHLACMPDAGASRWASGFLRIPSPADATGKGLGISALSNPMSLRCLGMCRDAGLALDAWQQEITIRGMNKCDRMDRDAAGG